jgi:hypothetical protein
MEPCAELGAEWSGLLRFDRTHPPLIAMQAGALLTLLVAFSETVRKCLWLTLPNYEPSKPRRVMMLSKCQEKTHRQKWTFEHMVEEAEAVFTFGPSAYTETGDQYIGVDLLQIHATSAGSDARARQ